MLSGGRIFSFLFHQFFLLSNFFLAFSSAEWESVCPWKSRESLSEEVLGYARAESQLESWLLVREKRSWKFMQFWQGIFLKSIKKIRTHTIAGHDRRRLSRRYTSSARGVLFFLFLLTTFPTLVFPDFPLFPQILLREIDKLIRKGFFFSSEKIDSRPTYVKRELQ